MGLETATYIEDLVITNPTGTDDINQGDNHLRLIKSILQNNFPSLGEAAMNATAAQLNFIVGVTSSVQDQLDALTLAKAPKEGSTTQRFDVQAPNANDQAIRRDTYAAGTTGGTLKARRSGSTLYLTANGNNA